MFGWPFRIVIFAVYVAVMFGLWKVAKLIGAGGWVPGIIALGCIFAVAFFIERRWPKSEADSLE